MISAKATGVEEAIKTSTRLRYLLGTDTSIQLVVSDLTETILGVSIGLGRDVVTGLSEDEANEVRTIIRKHVDLSRSEGRSEEAWKAMWMEVGTFWRTVVAEKINDQRPVTKDALTDDYREYKEKAYSHGANPILVASGAMLKDVQDAAVEVGPKGVRKPGTKRPPPVRPSVGVRGSGGGRGSGSGGGGGSVNIQTERNTRIGGVAGGGGGRRKRHPR